MADAFPQTLFGNGAPSSLRFGFEETVATMRSPFKGTEQRTFRFGLWVVEFGYVEVDPDEADPIVAFLRRHGKHKTFTLFDPTHRAPKPVWAHASGAVNGASEAGTTLTSDGWPNSTTLFHAGDRIELQGAKRYHEITATVASDGSGNASLPIWPPIPAAESPPNDDPIVVVDPKLYVRADQVVVPEYPPGVTRLSFGFAATQDLSA